MRGARSLLLGLVVASAGACVSAPPAGGKAPGIPAYAAPVIPASLGGVTPELRQRHEAAWLQLQAGDLRGAARSYTECLRSSATFYPAEAGLGFVALAGRDFNTAVARFRSALGRNERYVPAWRGLVDAELGAGHDDEAIAALERLLALDASQESDRSRLELLRLKQLQTLVDAGVRARDAGRLDEADRVLARALVLSPRSPIVLRELAQLEIKRGQLDEAEAHARRAIEIDATDARAHATLASVLEARGQVHQAAMELAQAAALDPAYRERAQAMQARADAVTMPAEMRDLGSQSALTRSQLAALIGTRLPALLARAPRTIPVVATDLRGHWAATWIVTVTQAGIMDVFANHTFQPSATVRRADLAQAVSALVALASAPNPDQLSRWQSARPSFADLGPSNLLYPPAALAVAAGAMSAVGGRFDPTRAATGAEALAAITRVEQLVGRGR